jgi:LmbE family N-acetylglucosaminyl deacetylase
MPFVPAAPDPVVVVSPHLDDAVFSCGELLASRPGSYVITVFAGGPSSVTPLTGWDRECGFLDGQDIIGARRQEDVAALALLSASPIFLDLWDLQYRDSKYGYSGESERQLVTRGSEELRAALLSLPANTWVVPVGIHHLDHKLCRRMALRLFTRQSHATWLLYEELAYYHLSRTQRWSARIAVSSALATTGSFTIRHDLSRTELATETKTSAMQRYASQMRRLSSDFARLASIGPESYLRISTPWAGMRRAPHTGQGPV